MAMSIQAQDIKGGLKVSFGMPVFSDDVENSASGTLGYSIGYFETMKLSNSVALEGEINYTSISYETGEGDNATDESTSFIELPIMIKYVSGDFHIGGGLQFTRGGVNDFGPVVDMSYYSNNLRFGLRSFLGSKKEYSGNSVINSSIFLGLIIF